MVAAGLASLGQPALLWSTAAVVVLRSLLLLVLSLWPQTYARHRRAILPAITCVAAAEARAHEAVNAHDAPPTTAHLQLTPPSPPAHPHARQGWHRLHDTRPHATPVGHAPGTEWGAGCNARLGRSLDVARKAALLMEALAHALPLPIQLPLSLFVWMAMVSSRDICPTKVRTCPRVPGHALACTQPVDTPTQLLQDPVMDARVATFHHYAALASYLINPLGTTFIVPRTQYSRCAAVQCWFGAVLYVAAPLVALALQQVRAHASCMLVIQGSGNHTPGTTGPHPHLASTRSRWRTSGKAGLRRGTRG